MSVNGDAARRDMWAEHIERCPASDMAIGEWCSLNKVNKSSLYRWLAVFCDEGPGSSAGKNSETSGWAKAMRDGIAAAKAIEPVVSTSTGRGWTRRPASGRSRARTPWPGYAAAWRLAAGCPG